MGETTRISWAHATFNPWWGCEKVSPACTNCYAERDAKRLGHEVWGKHAPRRFLSDGYWLQPLKWNAAARQEGERRRVFCASMADVFEDRPDIHGSRERLWDLIRSTPWLDWLLLTKRPENVWLMTPGEWHASAPANVWYGTTVEDQAHAEHRIAELVRVPARIRFLSCEPLLGPVDLREHFRSALLEPTGRVDDRGVHMVCTEAAPLIHWVIAGGESGPGSRFMDQVWIERLRDDCAAAGVAFFLKQLGVPFAREHGLKDPKGADPAEWPEDLRVQQFPHPGKETRP